ALQFIGPLTPDFGDVVLSARLTDTVDAPTAKLAGKTITFTISGQTFSATTDATGVATVHCSPAYLTGAVDVRFAGDDYYTASATTATISLHLDFGSTDGFFAVAQSKARVGGSVTFWSSQWAKANISSAPSSFKGYVSTATTAACGASWNARPGNSGNPPS